MAQATDKQVQNFVDTRIRPHAAGVRAIELALADDIGAIDDIYAALTAPSPTWGDNNPNGPPHLLAPADVLAINSFMHDIRDAILNHAAYPVVLKACVNPVVQG